MRPGDVVVTLERAGCGGTIPVYRARPEGGPYVFDGYIKTGLPCLVVSIDDDHKLEIITPSGKCQWVVAVDDVRRLT